MLVSIRKGRPDSICHFVSNPSTMVIVKDDSGQRIWWKVLCKDSANIFMYPIDVSTAEEGP